MRYQADGTQMWDGWFLNVEDRVHLFHMQVPPAKGTVLPEREHQAVGHAYTDDLVHWTQCPRLLHPLYDEAPMDYHQKFTGCAAQKDGTYYVLS